MGYLLVDEGRGELEVSVRTVYRDVAELSGAGVPVYATRGRSGGFRLLDGFRASLSAVTGDEAQALGFAGLPSAARDLGLGAVLTGAQLKLLDALPPAVRERAGAVQQRFLLDAPGWAARPETPRLLARVAAATWSGHALRVRYRRTGPGGPVTRELLPLGLVLKAGTWYLVGAPLHRGVVAGNPRTYRVSRLQAVTVHDAQPAPPVDFDLPTFWTGYQADYEERLYPASVTARFGPAAWALLFLLGPIPAREARTAAGEPDDEGWRTTTVPIESERHALHALLQLGRDVEVLAPASLRDVMAAEARALAALYSSSSR